MDIISMAYAKKLVNGLQSGLDNASVDNNTCSITFHWKNGTSSTMTFPKPLDGANGVGISDVKLKEVTVGSGKGTHLICTLEDGTEIDAGNIPGGSGGTTNYDDTQVKADIADLKSDKQDKTDNLLKTTDKTVTGAINEINGNLLGNVTFSADYKNIIINRKSGLNPYTIPIASIIHNAKIAELNDVDSTNIGDGKTLVYDGATQKHKYVDSTGTDELVKMDSTTDAKHLSELIDKLTIINDNGVLKVKKLDGQEVTIAEINYLKGLTMNVMDLVNLFANGGVKVLNTPVNTYADLSKLDRSKFIDGISYIVYVLADETHSGAKTTYLCDKTSETFFGNADSQRNFITNPINLANEVAGKLGTSNIDVDSLWSLLTINDTYKTLTTKNEPFGTHGAKALYDELVTSISKKANATDLTTHTSDTNIHITTAERDKWNEVDDKIKALKTAQSLEYKGESVICNNTLASRTSDMFIKGKTYVNLGTGGLESAGEKENKISISSNNNKSADDVNYKEYKKEILLPIEGGLKSLPNEVGDTIEQRNDGVYLVQRVCKVVLNGSEAWTKSSWSMTNTFKFDFEIGLVAKLFDLNATNQILCDTFKVVSRNSLENVANREFECICASNVKSRTLSITVSKTKLNNTNTGNAFKQWLSNNPVTVCYELETPVETKLDINNLDLEVYKDTTYVATDNAIQPTLSFKVPSNMGGVMQGNAQNINKLYKQINEGVKKTDIVDNLTSTNTDKPLSAKQGKILNDKKLNKVDVNKFDDLINLDSVSLKEYILENCTEEKVYHLIARSTCTDIPKDNAHFYVIVEKVGSFTHKITAKELNTNEEYTCTYRSDTSTWYGWDKIALGDYNLKTYTDINQLGLTTPVTVGEIFSTMPNFSLLRFQVDNYSVTDAPAPNGILIIDKIRSAKFSIEFKISADGSVAQNSLYIGQLKGSDASGLSWKRVCTTSVADMSPSEISSFVDTDVSGVINYRVKNGICFVKIWGMQSKTAGKSKFLLNDSSMPIPDCFDTGNALFEANGDGTANAFAFVDNKGALIAHFYKANSEVYGSFSYPVSES